MLLSLLSKRSLEVDSRDSYGFALRPQHAQRYREYTFIYKKEEEERSDKWRKFLEQRAKSSQPCSSNNEHKEGEDSSGRNSAEDAETKGEISVDKDCDGGDSSGSHLVESAEAKEGKIDERVSEGDNSNDRKPLEGTNINEGKSKVQTWAEIRPSLNAIDKMMSFRVKTGRNMKGQQMNATSDHLPSVVESEPLEGISEEDTEQRVCINETSDDGIDTPENSIGDQHSLELFSPRKELESLVQGGVPKDLRGEVWQAFVGVKTRRVESYYEDLLAQETNSSESKDQDVPSGEFGKWRKQIEKDIPRTFPGHPALDENGRNSLRRLLLAYARHNPSVGYCQAMNFFAGLLLLLMPEENAFWAFVGIIDDYFEGYYTEEMIESQVDQLVFEELMRERFPKLVNHLDYLGVQVTWISGPWFLSIFVNMIPWESVLRVWDVMLFEGNRIMLFRTALALMELYGPALVATKDAGDAITLLQSLVGSTFDSSQLVFTACMGFLAVTEARLQEMREKHRPSVLVVVEERSKKGRALKDSKVVATKLYSFKHDRGSVVDEKKTTKGSDKVTDEDKLHSESHSSNLDESLRTLNVDSELGSLTDLRDQVVWLKVELCRTLEQKRSAELRAEELETALMEIVKQDNGHQLSARVEQLEQEVAELQQDLADKEEQEDAMLQVLLKVEQDHRVAEDLRRRAEQDVTAQKSAIQTLQEKYDKAMASIYEMEKRVVVAESMLEATLQYESGQSKALSSPRAGRVQSPKVDNPTRKIGLLTFGLGWRDRNKGKPANVDDFGESKPNTPRMENVITPRKESDDRDHDR